MLLTHPEKYDPRRHTGPGLGVWGPRVWGGVANTWEAGLNQWGVCLCVCVSVCLSVCVFELVHVRWIVN